VVFYSVRAGAGEVLFEVLDHKLKVVGTLNMADFEGALEDQKRFPKPTGLSLDRRG
jgi:hypothetical protein